MTRPLSQVIVKRLCVALGMNIYNRLHLAMDVRASGREMIINIWAEQLRLAAMSPGGESGCVCEY